MPKNLCPVFLAALAAGSCLVATQQAQASGFATARFGAEHGTPASANPTAVYYNPAGIAESPGYHIFLDGTLALRSASFEHKLSASDKISASGTAADPKPGEDLYPESANAGKATLFNVLAIPMIGVSANWDGFAVGAGVYVPFGGTSMWGTNDAYKNDTKYPGPVDGQQRWYSINGTIKSTYFTVATAYKIPESGLSLGVSLNLIESVVHTLRARISDGSNDLNTEGRSYTDVKGKQMSFGLGAMYEAIPEELWFGLSYQSRPNVSGGMVLKGSLRNHFLSNQPAEDVRIEQDLPDIFRLGVRYRMPENDIELRLFGDFTRWSALKNQCMGVIDEPCRVREDGGRLPGDNAALQNLQRNWNDTFNVRAGLSYWLSPPVEVMFGGGYASNAIPDKALDPALMDFDCFSVAAGSRVQVSDPLFLALTYSHVLYLTRDTTGKSANPSYEVPSRGPDSGGIYKQTIGLINVNAEMVF